LYENKDKIGGFANNYYWSSTEATKYVAWVQSFDSGNQGGPGNKNNTNYVRAVRDF
jgi:hypothetical protein